MTRQTSLERWAEKEQFGHPLKWGQVEQRLMRRRVPLLESDSRATELFLGAAGLVLIFCVVIPLLCAPPLAPIALSMAGGPGVDAAPVWIEVATAALLVSTLMAVAFIVGWFLDRSGTFWGLLLSGAISGCSLASIFLLQGLADIDGAVSASRYAVAGTAAGALSFLLIATTKPALEWPFDKRDPNLPKYKYMYPRYEQARTTVLSILESRGLARVDPEQREKLRQAPLGTWHTFDPEQ